MPESTYTFRAESLTFGFFARRFLVVFVDFFAAVLVVRLFCAAIAGILPRGADFLNTVLRFPPFAQRMKPTTAA